MSSDITVIVNEASGRAAASGGAIEAALRRAGVDAHIIRLRGVSFAGDVQRAARQSRVIVAAGGDGTVSAVASAAVECGSTLGILPLGTLNHFARDVGIPTDLEKAAEVIASGHVRAVDVGEVNGRTFVNNASLGVYPRLVCERELERRRNGRHKWIAFAIALLRTWRRYPTVTVRMSVDGTPLVQHTPFVVVANGEYRAQGLGLGSRMSLDCRQLWIYVAPECGRFEILGLPFRALAGRLTSDVKFESAPARDIVIETARRQASIAVDGELTMMSSPLQCSIRPGALRVLVPASA